MVKKKILITTLLGAAFSFSLIGANNAPKVVRAAPESEESHVIANIDGYDFFESLNDLSGAYGAMNDDELHTITFERDVSGNLYLTLKESNKLKIDLKGHTWNIKNYYPFIAAEKNSELYITDSSVNKTGKIVCSDNDIVSLGSNVKFIMDSGTLQSTAEYGNIVPIRVCGALAEGSYVSGGTFIPKTNGYSAVVGLGYYDTPENSFLPIKGIPDFQGGIALQKANEDGSYGYIKVVGELSEDFSTAIYCCSSIIDYKKDSDTTLLVGFDEQMPNADYKDYFYSGLEDYLIGKGENKYFFDTYSIETQPTRESPTVVPYYVSDVVGYRWNKVSTTLETISEDNKPANIVIDWGDLEGDVIVPENDHGSYEIDIYDKTNPVGTEYTIVLVEGTEPIIEHWEDAPGVYHNEPVTFDENNELTIKTRENTYYTDPVFSIHSNAPYKIALKTYVHSYTPIEGQTTATYTGTYKGEVECDVLYKNDIVVRSDIISVGDINTSIHGNKVDVQIEIPAGPYKEGFDYTSDLNLEVEVVVEAEVSQANKIVDYSNLPTNVKLGEDEKISTVFSVKLIQTIDGNKKEIQPSDIKDGTKIKIKMELPNDVDVDKVLRILHVHSASDIEALEFDKTKVANGFYEITVTKLSEFAFVCKVEAGPGPAPVTPSDDNGATNPEAEKNCFLHWIILALLVVYAGYTMLDHMVISKEKGWRFKIRNCAISGAFVLATLVLGLIGFIGSKCIVCLVLACVNFVAVGGGVVQYRMRRNEEERKESDNK